jgi:hypothetical protein
MTARDAAQRPSAAHVAEALRRIAAGGDIDRTTIVAPAPRPDATAVLPATAVVTQQAGARTAAAAPAAQPARRGVNRVLVAALVIAIAAAVAIGVALARQNNGAPSSYQPGQPTLKNSQLEHDMQDLEKLVRR